MAANRAWEGRQANEPVTPPEEGAMSGDSSFSRDRIQDQTERALLERPSFGIRARLTLGFLLFFFLSTAVTVTAWVTLNRLEQRLKFLEIADRYTTEIQQARRFEKNYFLYGTNLEDVLEHVQNASRLLISGKTELQRVVGKESFKLIEQHQNKYTDLLLKLRALEANETSNGLPQHPDIEAELREHGAAMVFRALALAEGERRAMNLTLKLFKRLPLYFLVILLFLLMYTARFLARQMLAPLSRMMAATQRIAKGDFTPIPPARRFRDEFTNLVIALNHMMEELQHRHDVLAESHKLRAVGTLTAGIAHELNNPINNITLTAATLEEDAETMDQEERLEMIRDLVEQAERASRIVRNLLDFARESEINTQLLDIGELLRETVRLAINEIKLKKAKVHLQTPDNLPKTHGDRQALSQVFLNLILNAVDAMTRAGGILEIQASKSGEPGFLVVRVKDNGSGIPEHLLSSIFDPFFTTKMSGRGTGLGLSVSLGIVKKHGGDIQVESRAGKGTTFIVLLPIISIPADLEHEDS